MKSHGESDMQFIPSLGPGGFLPTDFLATGVAGIDSVPELQLQEAWVWVYQTTATAATKSTIQSFCMKTEL